jgi:hypothetical protein
LKPAKVPAELRFLLVGASEVGAFGEVASGSDFLGEFGAAVLKEGDDVVDGGGVVAGGFGGGFEFGAEFEYAFFGKEAEQELE